MKFWHDSHITISTTLEKLKKNMYMFNFFNEDIEDNEIEIFLTWLWSLTKMWFY